MEPTAPKAGPDLLVVKDESYYAEMRKVGLAEWDQTYGKKKAKYALTSTGLLMEGLGRLICPFQGGSCPETDPLYR